MNAKEFNRQWKLRRREIEREVPELARAYEKLLERLSKQAVARFHTQNVTAAAWQPPPDGNLIDPTSSAEVGRLHKRILVGTAGPTLAKVGISWDVTNPFVVQLLEQAGKRTGVALGEAVTPILQETIGDAYERGLSVVDTAALITEKLADAKQYQARMLARTDLNGLANGASVMTARMVGVTYKQWLTAEDDKVREQHVDADGQTVPVEQPFQVCGENLDYPGDPAGSDACTCNCRCTVIYADAPEAAAEVASAAYAQPVTVQVAAATTAPETTAAISAMGDLIDGLAQTVADLARPTVRRVTVQRNELGEIVSMTIREER